MASGSGSIWTAWSIRGSEVAAGLLDTSVVIDWDDRAVAAALPDDVAVCAVTVAELAAGPHLASSGAERAKSSDERAVAGPSDERAGGTGAARAGRSAGASPTLVAGSPARSVGSSAPRRPTVPTGEHMALIPRLSSRATA